ncbi:MAG TPA: M1 family metallopeptidase [Puia sp.]|nr:M1 family metallopeptidase [Puia sp.]
MHRITFILVLSVMVLGATLAQTSLTSGGKLKPEQAIIDIRHYTIDLNVDIDNKSIAGYAEIGFDLKQSTQTLLFDLVDSFNVRQVLVNGHKSEFKYENNAIRISTPMGLSPGKSLVKIIYDGKPHVARRPPWDDGFTWSQDSSGNPWIAVTAEGSGGKLYFPCKDHPSDEPDDGVDLIITVPKGLVVAGPGLLQSVKNKGNKSTFHWKTQYTINNYSIVFNVAKYKVVTRTYTSINGNKVPLQFYVLEQDASKAQHHLDVFERTIHEQEKYFGEYPWIKEKIAIAETPHLGMEHQTMNAYGNRFRYTKVGGEDYDWLLHHEFGHEWWGNKMTAKDWGDYWIHEGICSFGDALYTREFEGEKAYIKLFQQTSLRIRNNKPVVLGQDIDEESAYNDDIYSKGAFFMHTLCYVLSDSIFFPILRNFITDPKYTYDNLVCTDDVRNFFSKSSGIDLKPLFQMYLYTTDKLEVNVIRKGLNTYLVKLGNLDMTIPMEIVSDNGNQRLMLDERGIEIKSSTPPQIDPDMFYLKRVVME